MISKKAEAPLAIFLIVSAIVFVFALYISNPPTPVGLSIADNKIQCQDNMDNDEDTFTDYPADPGCSSRFDNDEGDEPVCTQNWVCSPWSDCIDNNQTRFCNDKNQCQEKIFSQETIKIIERPKPLEEQNCTTSSPMLESSQPLLDEKIENPPVNFFKKTKEAISNFFYFVKMNYGAFIILILSVAVIISGYFAYRSFIDGNYLEHWKERRLEQEEIRKEQKKAKEKQKKIKERQEKIKPKIEAPKTTQPSLDLEPLSQELSYFIRDAFLAGYSSQQIKKTLLLNGWPKKITETYVGKIYQFNRKYIFQTQESKTLKKEMQQLRESLKRPKEEMEFYQKPLITKENISPQPWVIKPKRIKETPESKLLQEELIILEEELKKSSLQPIGLNKSQKTSRTLENYLGRLEENIFELAKKGRTKKEIIQILVKENWPEDLVRRHIKKYFPHLERISFFKKEVTAFENVLKKLKQR